MLYRTIKYNVIGYNKTKWSFEILLCLSKNYQIKLLPKYKIFTDFFLYLQYLKIVMLTLY